MVDLRFSSEDEAFRAEVRAFVAANLPAELARKVRRGSYVSREEQMLWQRPLIARGWLAPAWPAEYGGCGWDPVKRFIFDEETAIAGAPRGNIPGIDLLAPILLHYGSEEQKRHYLPRILSGEDWWCQGFSEPQAGSDLAALKCRADRDGDTYVINGSKIWTSHAHAANWIFCLVRTSQEAKKQAGISFVLVPMDAPGVSVSPIVTLGGMHSVNQVFFDDVRVPVANRIGEEGAGWRMTGVLLGHERLVGAGLGPSQRIIGQLREIAARPEWQDDAGFQLRLARLETALMALRYTAYRVLAAEMAGAAPGPEVSVLKVEGTRIQQELSGLLMDAAGPAALVDPHSATEAGSILADGDEIHAAAQYLDLRKLGIYGGANEVQRNILARRMLGL